MQWTNEHVDTLNDLARRVRAALDYDRGTRLDASVYVAWADERIAALELVEEGLRKAGAGLDLISQCRPAPIPESRRLAAALPGMLPCSFCRGTGYAPDLASDSCDLYPSPSPAANRGGA